MAEKIIVNSRKNLQELTAAYQEKGYNIITYWKDFRELEKDHDITIIEYESPRTCDFEVMTVNSKNQYTSYIVRTINSKKTTDRILDYFNKRGFDVVNIEKVVTNTYNPAPIKI